jgi:DNA-binding IclR family transcriptional regulator
MSLDTTVLRALLRLARRRTPRRSPPRGDAGAPLLEQLVVRVGASEPEVRKSLASLARSGLVQRTPAGLRLSLAGLAVAVAVAAPRTAKPTKKERAAPAKASARRSEARAA